MNMKPPFTALFGKLTRLLANPSKLKLFLIYVLRHPSICLREMPSFEHFHVIRHLQPDLVLVVGFNKGQFTALCSILYKILQF